MTSAAYPFIHVQDRTIFTLAERNGAKSKHFPDTLQRLLFRPIMDELTQIKCYQDGEVDEGSADTLTHNCGYPSPEHESICQA